MGKLETILGSAAKVVLLRTLANAEQEMTGRQVWEALRTLEGGPRGLATVQRALDDLVSAGIVERRGVPGSPAKLHRLDRRHPLVYRGILPLLELDRPADDPAATLRSLLSDVIDELGLLSVTMEPLDETSGEIVVHYLTRSGAAEVPLGRFRRIIAFVAEPTGRGVRLEPQTFQGVREKAQQDPVFRRRAIERGINLGGSELARLADTVPAY